jgi:hypothetical protein
MCDKQIDRDFYSLMEIEEMNDILEQKTASLELENKRISNDGEITSVKQMRIRRDMLYEFN